MNDLVCLLTALNLLVALIVFMIILRDNDDDFIKWVKHSFEARNWFGKLQICFLIVWMIPIIIICTVVFPISLILGNIIVGIILGCMKLVELGKK